MRFRALEVQGGGEENWKAGPDVGITNARKVYWLESIGLFCHH